tara:strand:+ start:857 stop:1396 length:540 start_codon:yes stop_codon:yes gene_type:complete
MVGHDQFSGESHPGSVEVSGRVKWFNAAKGFGFLTPVDSSGDVFIHLSTLRQAGHEGVDEGATVVCEAVRGPKGLQAIRLIDVDTTTAIQSGTTSQEDEDDPRYPPLQADSDLFEVMVKWFNIEKGYGFVTRGEGTQDIFIHIKTIRKIGFADLKPGQLLHVRTGQGPKGPQVAEIELD